MFESCSYNYDDFSRWKEREKRTNKPGLGTLIWAVDVMLSLLGDFCTKGVGIKLLRGRMKLKPNQTKARYALLSNITKLECKRKQKNL